MKTLQKFEAMDGVQFDSQTECMEYEDTLIKIRTAMSGMPERPNTHNFDIGHGYIQHEADVFMDAKLKVLEIVQQYWSDDKILTYRDNPFYVEYNAHVLSIVKDINIRELLHAWMRFVCTDASYKEWGMPIFVLEKKKTKNIKLN